MDANVSQALAELARSIAYLVGLIVAALILQIGQTLLTALNTWLARIQNAKIDKNTDVTEAGKIETVKEIKSATKDVKEQATHVAIIAKQAVNRAETAAATTSEATKELAATTEHIRSSLNGRLAEKLSQVDDHHVRITRLETDIAELKQTSAQILSFVERK